MRLLWIAPYLPYPVSHGGKVRVLNLLRRIGARHEVRFLAVDDRATIGDPDASYAPLEDCCASVTLLPRYIPAGARARVAQILSPLPMAVSEATTPAGMLALRKALDSYRFDAAIIEQVQAGEYLRELARAGLPTLLVCHNVEQRIWQGFARYAPSAKKRLRAELEARKMARYEPRVVRRATARLAVSEDDRRLLERLSGRPCGLSPNGVDTDFFAFQPRPPHAAQAPWRLVMTGSMSYAPNIDAATYFLDSILPRLRQAHPAIEVRFVGSAPSPELLARQDAAGQVRFTGLVEDVRPYVAESDLFIAPLRHGSGTRLKLLEAMAQGVPVVTTSAGCEGLSVASGEQLWIADTPEAFADGVARLMSDETLRASMAVNARALVEREYGWGRIADDLEAELRRIAAPVLAPRA